MQAALNRAGVATDYEQLDGLVENKKPTVLDLPRNGKPKRYILTCAQNNTGVNQKFFDNLVALAEFYDAELMVSRVTYNKMAYEKMNIVKPGTSSNEKGERDELWYDPLI